MESDASVRPESATREPKPLILVADDEQPILDLLQMKLARAGFEVVAVADGEAAWQEALRRPPALALVDYRMPIIDGLELCQKLLMHPKTHRVPVLIITSRWCKVTEQFRQLSNVVGLMGKPLNFNALVANVQKLVAEHASKSDNKPVPETTDGEPA